MLSEAGSSLSLIEVYVWTDTKFVHFVKETDITIIKMMRNKTGTFECIFILVCCGISLNLKMLYR